MHTLIGNAGNFTGNDLSVGRPDTTFSPKDAVTSATETFDAASARNVPHAVEMTSGVDKSISNGDANPKLSSTHSTPGSTSISPFGAPSKDLRNLDEDTEGKKDDFGAQAAAANMKSRLNESAPPFIPMSQMNAPSKLKEQITPPVLGASAPMLEMEVMQLWQRLQAKTIEAQGLDKQLKEKFMSLEQARRQILNLEQQLRNIGMDQNFEESGREKPSRGDVDRKETTTESQSVEKNSISLPNSPHGGNGGISSGNVTPNVDSLPSKGSVGHASGTCKRCCFFPRGRCMSGQDCMFCHFDHEKRKRKSKSKRSSLGSSTLNSNDSTGEDVQWGEVAKDILGMLRGSTSEKNDDSPVHADTVTPTPPIAPVAPPHNRLEIQIGGEYEGKAADGSWWPCRITANNYDGTFEASVHDAYNSKWSKVHRMNLRPTQHSPSMTRFDSLSGRQDVDARGGRYNTWAS